MEIIVADQIIMGLILNAGDAKQHVYQACKQNFQPKKQVGQRQRLQLCLCTHKIT